MVLNKALAGAGILLLGLAAEQSSATAASLLVNGGFEEPVQGSPNFASFNIPAGSTLITGWNVVQGNVDLTTDVNYGPGNNTLHPGSVQDVDLIGDNRASGGVYGGLSQSFATTVGQGYRLTFDYSHNPGTFSPDYAAQVTVADAIAATTIFSVEISQIDGPAIWQIFSQDFIAISNSTLLTFIATRGAFNAGIYLDEVSVEPVNAVPLPATLPLFAGGLGLMGWLARRRQRKQHA